MSAELSLQVCAARPGSFARDCRAATQQELLFEIGTRADAHAAQQASDFNRLISTIVANTKATEELSKKLDASITANNAAFKNQLAENIFARIDALPLELAKNEQAYEAIKKKLIADVGMIFGLEPRKE
ncbi:hypothetical protein [Agrobacterium sp. El2ro-1b]|uniref:hypothetical protein n=1 Tax=Agrobacterium sp. El2ro-1b TaxID=2969528 RepID=UPI003AACC629